MRRLLILLLTLSFLTGCAAGEADAPSSGTELSAPEYRPHNESEIPGASGDVSVGSSSHGTALAIPPERFAQITSRPLRDWTTKDFAELLSLSNHDLAVDLKEHWGGRNIVLGIIGASVHFPYGYEAHLDNFDPFPVYRGDDPDFPPVGYLKYPDAKDYSEELYPAAVTIGYHPHGSLLGLELRESRLNDAMEFFNESALEYVVRVGGGVKANIYFVSGTLDGLVFLFEGDLTGEISQPLPTISEILDSKIYNVHILKEDCLLLDGRMERWVLSVEEYTEHIEK